MNSTRWIGWRVAVVRQLVIETGLIVCQNTLRHSQYDRLSQQQLSFLHDFITNRLRGINEHTKKLTRGAKKLIGFAVSPGGGGTPNKNNCAKLRMSVELVILE